MHLKSLLLATALTALATPTLAQGMEAPVSIDLPAQRLDQSLMQLSRTAAIQLVFFDDEITRLRAPALTGKLSFRDALDRLLAGTPYTYRVANARSVRIVRRSAAATPGAALAPQQMEEAAGDEVVVTGSRVARSTLDTPAPVVTVSRDDLAESGDTELSETLAELPSVSSSLNDSAVTGNVQNSGLSSIQLRNLGDNRTLVLVDGRRTVSNSANANRVSLSTIPSDFIERVEIVTGGTSSVYGSDAVAGVVNIITETNQQGFRLGARAGVSERGDGQEMTFTGSFGTRFAEDRGYFLVSGTYDRDDGIRAADRDWAIAEFDFDYDEAAGINEIDTLYLNGGVPTSGNQPSSTFPPNVARDLSGNTPGGVFYGQSSSRDRFYIGSTLVPLGPDVQTGGVVPPNTSDNGNAGFFLPNRDGYNQRTGRDLVLPRTRYLAAAKLNFDFSDSLSAFAQVQYSRVESTETREPIGIGFESTFQTIDPVTGVATERAIGRIPCRRTGACNPFVPAVIRSDFSNSTAGVAWDRRFVEVGDQITENVRETVRSWAGLRGDLGGSWNWEASAGFGQFRQDQMRRNEINGVNLIEGLNAELGPDGLPRCISAAARAAGCVPVNLFGAGSITPEAADYIRADLAQEAVVRQYTAQAFVTGDLFTLPAGPVRVAVGTEFRKDEQELRGDLASQLGGTTGNPVPNFSGSIRAIEGYGEISVPLLANVPGAHLLTLDASARVGNYDIAQVGTVFSYRAGLQWAPVPDLRFRAQYARAQRAPDLTELFSPPRGDFDTVTDLCDGVTPTTAGRIAANCRANPGIQALFAQQIADGDPQLFEQDGSSVYSPNAGNLALKEETADTFTVGAVIAPRFVPGLTIAVDYYDIRVKDAISSYANEDILIQCYDSDLPAADNPFCGDVRRNASNGQISELLQRQFNLSSLRSSGIDVAVQYRFSLEDAIGVPGRFDIRYDGTHNLKQESRFEGLAGTVVTDQRGDLSAGSFKYRARGSLAWQSGGVRLRWTTTYLGSTYDSLFRLNQYRALLATNPNAEYPMFLKIDGVFEHDIYASFETKGDRKMRFYAGVNNLFDRTSPFLPTGDVFSGRLTNYNGAYDVAGRRFYVGTRVDF